MRRFPDPKELMVLRALLRVAKDKLGREKDPLRKVELQVDVQSLEAQIAIAEKAKRFPGI